MLTRSLIYPLGQTLNSEADASHLCRAAGHAVTFDPDLSSLLAQECNLLQVLNYIRTEDNRSDEIVTRLQRGARSASQQGSRKLN